MLLQLFYVLMLAKGSYPSWFMALVRMSLLNPLGLYMALGHQIQVISACAKHSNSGAMCYVLHKIAIDRTAWPEIQ